MISMNKKYQTRDGRPVELLTTSARGEWPVVGHIGGENQVILWTIDGVCSYSHSGFPAYDLVEVTPKRVMWLNVYPDDDAYMPRTRKDADDSSRGGRIACLKIEFEEGQFDD